MESVTWGDTWTMENVIHDKMNSRVRGSFLSLEGNQTIWWVREERKERRKKEKKRKKRKKKRREKKQNRGGGRFVHGGEKKMAPIPDVLKVKSC